MNFFKLYIGDYLRDTGTLTVAEHGAYMLMLMHYYATEQNLPSGRELHRLIRAETKSEREAVDSVVAKFWHEGKGGTLFNPRAAEELIPRQHQRDVNREIGKRGGRPKRSETESVPKAETESVSESEPNRNPNHSHSQKPEEESPAKAGASSARASPEPGIPEPDPPSPAAMVCLALRRLGMANVNPGNQRLRMLLDAGATLAEFEAHADKAIAKGGDAFAYLLGIVEGERKRVKENGGKLHRGAMPEKPSATVTADPTEALQARGEAVGVGRWDRGSLSDYRERVVAAEAAATVAACSAIAGLAKSMRVT